MCFFYLLILLLMMLGVKFSKADYHVDYIGKPQCNSVKGIFILVVFLRHVYPFLSGSGYEFNHFSDSKFLLMDKHIGQLLVVMFLFYSGYGVMESIKRKGKEYVDFFPRRRLLVTLLNFDVAVIGFILLDLLLGQKLSLTQVGWSLLGWKSVGNSNWYIFIILLCYLITYVAFRFQPKWGKWIVLLITFSSMLLLSYLKQSWWYNTILCYPAGMFFSDYKERWETMVKTSYIMPLVVCMSVFLFFHFLKMPRLHGITYNIESIAFALIVVLLTMKVRFQNPLLDWLGTNLFPLYIYQRMPMIAIQKLAGDEWLVTNPYLYVLACLFITCALAYGYGFWRIQLK